MSSDPSIAVNLVIDASAFQAAIRKAMRALNEVRALMLLLHWHSPANPYRHWPTCNNPVGHEMWFTTRGTKDRPCPVCGAAL